MLCQMNFFSCFRKVGGSITLTVKVLDRYSCTYFTQVALAAKYCGCVVEAEFVMDIGIYMNIFGRYMYLKVLIPVKECFL